MTLAISGHKFLGTSLSCGIILTSRDFLRKVFPYDTSVEYVRNIMDITFSGCRSGLAVLQIHNTLRSLQLNNDLSSIREIVDKNLKHAKYFYEKLCALLGEKKVLWLTK